MKKSTAIRSLLLSGLSMLLCFSMLIGSTFAWFTDEVTSGTNMIVAGNLDVELYHNNKITTTDKKVDGNTKLFQLSENQLWEPGAMVYENLTVANEGNLALKYQLGVNVTNAAKTADGRTLSDVLKVAVVEGGFNGDRADAEALTGYTSLVSFVESGKLYPVDNADGNATSKTYGIVIWWQPSDEDNYYNMNKGESALTIDLGVKLFATQVEAEDDSFGSDYDSESAVFSVAEANALLAAGKDATLVNCAEPDGVIVIPENAGTLTLNNVTVKAIQAEKDANIVILGDVVVNANGSGVSTFAAVSNGSAISANGKLNISGNGNLTAIATGDHAYGIGGGNATEITVKNVTIKNVVGGHAYGVGTDTKYYKDAPEGGAAIGSGKDGAIITLENVTVEKAIGGSKAAAIGAVYHVGVTVNINNSIIDYAEGGVSAAAIGGSRVSNGAKESGTTINIKDSTVTAQGGAYGAGIGSGYDTHCQANQPICTINISGASVINAQGGKYAAGVGTGYHNAGLAGVIEDTVTVNAKSGEKLYKDTYTLAMDIGFGVVDPSREAKDNASFITYKGEKIEIPEVVKGVSNAAELAAALSNGEKNINISGKITLTTGLNASDVTFTGITADAAIDFNGHNIGGSGTITYKNLALSTISLPQLPENGERYGWYGGIDYNGHSVSNYENCTIAGVFTLYSDTVNVKNCTFNPYIQDKEEFYHIFVYGSNKVNVEGSTFNYGDRAIKVYNEGGTKYIELNVSDCKFVAAEGAKVNKALINVDTTYLASVKINVKNVTIDDALQGVKLHNADGNTKVTVTVE